jgi:type VI secretion system protein ImpA
MAIDVSLLPPVSDDAPSGANLELEADFGALDRAARGKREEQYGSTVIPAEPPDWKETERLALELQERSHDLRVLTHLAIARLNLSGIPAFAEVLGQIRRQIEERWETVHPQLDPEDDNDPMLRSNALLRLQDPANVLKPMRDLPLAASPQTGPVTWRDIAIFRGAIEAEEGHEKMTEALIRGAFARTQPERLAALEEGLELALAETKSIPRVFDEKAGSGQGPDLGALQKLLFEMQKEVRAFRPAAGAEPEPLPEAAAEAPAGEGEPAGAAAPVAARGAAKPIYTIRSITAVPSRDDAIYLLELAADYFRANEPSSPLPMLIDRCRRLAAMEFMDILRDLAPDGLNQAQMIAGPQPEGYS